MIVLDQNAVEQGVPVVESAAVTHGGLFQSAHAGRGFARVHDPGLAALNCFHVLGSDGGHAAQAHEEIQGDPFGCEDRRGRAVQFD
jgi:hypothetical protein